MDIGYLLSPALQLEDINGLPLVGGRIRVYRHGTTTPYITYKDFNGNRNPAEVILDNKGMCILLADVGQVYDIYCEDRYHVEQWSRLNVSPGGAGGAGSGSITDIVSSDDSITVIRNGDTVDIKVNRDGQASALCAASAIRTTDGTFLFQSEPINSVGDDLYIMNGLVRAKKKWYHYDATVSIEWLGNPQNLEQDVAIFGPSNSETVAFDLSFPHVETLDLSGVVEVQYSSAPFMFSVSSMPEGMRAQVVNASFHAVEVGAGGGSGSSEGKLHRLLQTRILPAEADENHPAGWWLRDLDALDPEDPTGHPMVTAEQIRKWLQDGESFTLFEMHWAPPPADPTRENPVEIWDFKRFQDLDGVLGVENQCYLLFTRYQASLILQHNPADPSQSTSRPGFKVVRYYMDPETHYMTTDMGQNHYAETPLEPALPWRRGHVGQFLRVAGDTTMQWLEWASIDMSQYATRTELQQVQDSLNALRQQYLSHGHDYISESHTLLHSV